MRIKSWINQPIKTEKELKEIEETNAKVMAQPTDIIITEKIEKVEYQENGDIQISYEYKKHNLTKRINETAKLLKIDQAKKLMELIGISEENK